MSIFARLARWFAAAVPSDEMMEIPLNDGSIRRRMAETRRNSLRREDIEECGRIARRQLADLHTTTSPLARNR